MNDDGDFREKGKTSSKDALEIWIRKNGFEEHEAGIARQVVNLDNLKYIWNDEKKIDTLAERCGIVSFCEVEKFKCLIRQEHAQREQEKSNGSITPAARETKDLCKRCQQVIIHTKEIRVRTNRESIRSLRSAVANVICRRASRIRYGILGVYSLLN